MTKKWDVRFTKLAREVATWSKDPSTQIGAVIVNDERRVLATGYNGFPKGIADTPERYDNKEVKYETVIHAEMNAIYNAAANGISCKDATLYVYGLPVCSNCAKGIVQTGINRIVMDATDVPQRWIDSFDKTKDMFDEVGISWSLTGDFDW